MLATARAQDQRKIAEVWSTYFLPGFHPWKRDDRDLIALDESDYEAPILRPAAAWALRGRCPEDANIITL